MGEVNSLNIQMALTQNKTKKSSRKWAKEEIKMSNKTDKKCSSAPSI